MEKIWLSFFSIDNDNAVFYAEVPKGLFSEGMVLALGRDHALMLYGEDKWDSFLERIKTLPPENAKMLRPFFDLFRTLLQLRGHCGKGFQNNA